MSTDKKIKEGGVFPSVVQSEQVLEELVAQLIGQGYTRAAVTNEATILAQLEHWEEPAGHNL